MKKIILTVAILFSVQVFAQKQVPFLQDSLIGYVNYDGTISIAPAFEDGDFFYDGWAKVKVKGGWNWVNEKGEFLVANPVSMAGNFSEGYAFARMNGEAGYFLDAQGKKVLELNPEIDQVEPFSKGLAVVSKDTLIVSKLGTTFPSFQFGVINKEGQYVIRPQFDDVGLPSEGYFRIIKNGHIGLADSIGNLAIPPIYEYLSDVHDGLILFRKGKKYGFIDPTGKKIIKAKFENAGDFSEGIAPVQIDSLWGYIDKKGKWVIKPQFVWAESFSEGYAGVVQNRKWGFIDHQGGLIIPAKFEDYQPFQNGMSAVKMNGKWGFINSLGRMAVSPSYEIVGSFVNGFTRAEDRGVIYYIRTDGSTIVSYKQRVRFKGK